MNPQTIQSIVTINGQSQLGMSCPILVGIADKPSQFASIPSTNLVGTTTGRFYRISGYLNTTSGQSGNGDVSVLVGYTAPNGATTLPLPSKLTLIAGGSQAAPPVLISTIIGTAITYTVTYNPTGQYDLKLVAEMVMP